uniref:Capsular polysaccharide synthesis protein n=1 Tax=viral metagenome TaxID=1070528 RepID=A0A6C0DPJ5_9ZZZZ
MQKNIFLLWLQGWEHASWLNKQVAESWELNNNSDWKIHYIDLENVKDYVNDINYIYDKTKDISPQAKSDIIRLSLLKNHGGVWADATMLCMQPLQHWIDEAIAPAGLWMYHGLGGGMSKEFGPASWFIISEKDGYMITKWKEECDNYWNANRSANNYYWMDGLFKKLFENDEEFKRLWLQTPYLYCELDGQSHTLYHHGIQNNTQKIKDIFFEKPPYALKLSKTWNDIFPDINTEKCKNSNGYYAIELSKRKFSYKHVME